MRKTALMASAGPPANLIMPRKKKRGFLGNGQRGFTLIELLAVMAIIGVLSGIVVTSVSDSGEASRDAQTQQDAGTVGSAVAQFFADQPPTEVLVQKTVTVLGKAGILQESSSRWPEGYISVAYPQVFPADTSTVQNVLFLNTDSELSDLTVRGLLTRFNAIDFSRLVLGGYIEEAPDTATRTSQGFHNYLWLLERTTSAGDSAPDSSRAVAVFKLVSVLEEEASGRAVLVYQRLVGEDFFDAHPNDDAAAAGTVQFSTASQALSESSITAAISVTRLNGSSGAVGATVATLGTGTATGGFACAAGVDFITLSTTLAWADGETGTKQAVLSFCPDATVEPNETVNLAFSSLTGGATLGTRSTMVHTITNDDSTAADLSVTKTDSPDPVTVGQNLTYTITVTNNGPSTATGVTLTDTLPAGVTYVSTTVSQGSCSGTSTVTCAIGSLASGANATATIVVTAPTAAGTLTNTASVLAIESDPNMANNTASITTTINPPTVTVTKLADDDGVCDADCSLREAIAAAVSGDTVVFAPGLTGTINLTLGQLVINQNLIIQGPGAGQLSISGGNAIQGGAIYNNGSLTINDITFSGNSASALGGAIVNTGGLTITNSAFSANSSITYGGAIFNNGGLTITNSTFSGNTAGNAGGAIYNQGSGLTITNSTFSGNTAGTSGGAIYNYGLGGSLTITNSTFSGNSANGYGGAIVNGGGLLTITNGTFTGNSATSYGGAIINFGSLTITNSTFSGNSASYYGAAIYNEGGSLTITNSTFSGNTAVYSGGAINNAGGSLTITNSTFSGNSATVHGGAINNADGSLTITNSTFSGNSSEPNGAGGAIFNHTGGSLTITSSTITGNSAPNSAGGAIYNNGTISLGNALIAGNTASAFPDIYGGVYGVTSRGHNLLGNGVGASGLTNGVNGDLVGSAGSPIDPLLGPLALNGGATATRALLSGSPAIDAGDDIMCAAAVGTPSYGAGGLDQRGVARPQGAHCDIGAYEAAVGLP